MIKPWTMVSFPKDKPIWIRHKGAPSGSSMIVCINPVGVNVLLSPKGKGDAKMFGVLWSDLLKTCEQIDGSPCGRDE